VRPHRFRRALWDGSAPDEAGWLVVARGAAVEWEPDLPRGGDAFATVEVPAQRPDSAVPTGWRDIGFTRWVRILECHGRTIHALVRGQLAAPITIVGEPLVAKLDPGEFDAMLEWVHFEAGLPPLANGAGPAPEIVVGGRPDHACILYGPDARGVFERKYQNWGSELSLHLLEGGWLTDHIVRIERLG